MPNQLFILKSINIKMINYMNSNFFTVSCLHSIYAKEFLIKSSNIRFMVSCKISEPFRWLKLIIYNDFKPPTHLENYATLSIYKKYIKQIPADRLLMLLLMVTCYNLLLKNVKNIILSIPNQLFIFKSINIGMIKYKIYNFFTVSCLHSIYAKEFIVNLQYTFYGQLYQKVAAGGT